MKSFALDSKVAITQDVTVWVHAFGHVRVRAGAKAKVVDERQDGWTGVEFDGGEGPAGLVSNSCLREAVDGDGSAPSDGCARRESIGPRAGLLGEHQTMHRRDAVSASLHAESPVQRAQEDGASAGRRVVEETFVLARSI